MENAPYILIGVALLALLVLAGYLGYRAAKKRRELFAQFAQSHGWTWVAEDDTWVDRWSGPPFDQGDHRRAKNVLQGQRDGRPIAAFDYSYQTHSTDSKGNRTTSTHRYAVCAVGMPTQLPRLEVTHENVLTRAGRALGFADIELESEDFNRKFRVSCPDRKFATDVLHPRQMDMLLQKGVVAWRMEGSDLLCWDDGQHSPAQVLERLSLLDDILDGIPSFVWRDRGVTLERTGEPS